MRFMKSWFMYFSVYMIGGVMLFGCQPEYDNPLLEQLAENDLSLGRRVAYSPKHLAISLPQSYGLQDVFVAQDAGVTEDQLIEAFKTTLSQSPYKPEIRVEELIEFKGSVRHVKPGMILVSLGRKLLGLEVRDAYVEGLYTQGKDGFWRLQRISHQLFESDQVQNLGAKPINAYDALEEYGLQAYNVVASRRLIWSQRHAQELKPRLEIATEAMVESPEGDFYTLTFLDGSSALVEAYEHSVPVQGRVLGEVYQKSYLDAQKQLSPLGSVEFITDEGQSLRMDALGRFDLDEAVSGELILRHDRRVMFDQGLGQVVRFPMTLDEGDQVIAADVPEAALNAFAAVDRVEKFASLFLSTVDNRYFQVPLTVVTQARGQCNAFYNTGLNTINLIGAGGGCADTALVNDVVYHEWGHGLDLFTGRRLRITDGAFSEGLSDVVSAFITGDSVIGQGFVAGSRRGLRDIAISKSFPQDRSREVHREGLIIASTFWQLRTELIERYGEDRGPFMAAELFFRHLNLVDSYLESYEAVLLVDDDDNDLATRSPNHCLINKVFAEHGLAQREGCQDSVVEINAPLDHDLYVEILAVEAGGFKVLVGSPVQAEKIQICYGNIFACKAAGQRSEYNLVLEGVTAEGVFIYQSQEPQNLNQLDTVTILRLDAQGRRQGYREVRFAAR